MATLAPKFATVRPRVCGRGIDSARLLEEVVEEYAEDTASGIVWLLGEKGAGKSTALAHLAARFEGNPRIVFLDDADNLDEDTVCDNFDSLREKRIVVATRREESRTEFPQLRLTPWSVDELLEYLLPNYRDQCRDVLNRIGSESHQSWHPMLAQVVLDQLLRDPDLPDVDNALLAYLRQELPNRSKMVAARRYCLTRQLNANRSSIEVPKLLRILPKQLCPVLDYRSVQLRLAAEHICHGLEKWRLARVLEHRLPDSLIAAVGRLCKRKESIHARVEKILSTGRHSRMHAMAASILLSADPSWRPAGKRTDKDFSGAYFAKANWDEICLAGLPMQLADFTSAQLTGANFDEAIVVEADFDDANLERASFEKALAAGASFDRANLRQANLSQTGLESASLVGADLNGAELWKANLCRANLSDARFAGARLVEAKLVGANLDHVNFCGADLQQMDARRVDFRTAELAGANLEAAWLNGANLEDVVWKEARLPKAGLRGAHLTGSRLTAADLSEADLSGAGLGEIDWENADLRNANLTGATFHMGSSRSGLVDSYLASEGTRTGFYTDDLEELYFKSPEEVRKANLRGADLRGAKIDHVDFYLVDLRDAKLDLRQRAQAARTGAILSD